MMESSGSKVFTLGLKYGNTFKGLWKRIDTKLKGTFLEKASTYMKLVYTDYREVVISVKNDAKEKPFKATLFYTGMAFLGYSMSHNPNEQTFRAKFIDCCNEVSTVSPNLVNSKTVEHLKYIQRCYNQNLIRHTSLGLFSIIWVDNYSNQCGTYETTCSYLKLPYRQLSSRIIDFGFLNIWWGISRKMLDYDINY